jgi:hypothetical protein
MANTSQKRMQADEDSQSDQPEDGDRNKKNAKNLHVAGDLCQHRGVSVSSTAILRNITGRDYLRAAGAP